MRLSSLSHDCSLVSCDQELFESNNLPPLEGELHIREGKKSGISN